MRRFVATVLALAGCACGAAERPCPPVVYVAEVASEPVGGALVRSVDSGAAVQLGTAMLRVEIEGTYASLTSLGLPATGFVVHPDSRAALQEWTRTRGGREVAVVLGATALTSATLGETLSDGFEVGSSQEFATSWLIQAQLLPPPPIMSETRRPALQLCEVSSGPAAALVHELESGAEVRVERVTQRVEVAGVRAVTGAAGGPAFAIDVEPGAQRALQRWASARVGREAAVVLGCTVLARFTITRRTGATLEFPVPSHAATARLIEEQLRP